MIGSGRPESARDRKYPRHTCTQVVLGLPEPWGQGSETACVRPLRPSPGPQRADRSGREREARGRPSWTLARRPARPPRRVAALWGRWPFADCGSSKPLAGGKFALFRASDPPLAVLGRGRSRAWAPGGATPRGRALVPAARFPLRRLALRDLGARRPRGPPLRSAWAPGSAHRAPTGGRAGPPTPGRREGPRPASVIPKPPTAATRVCPVCPTPADGAGQAPCAPGSAPPPPSLLLSL